ncbi:Oleate hydratase [Penicillium subrubescens]|uniref:Oleate hydratase n=1 Tax=Penicillium subrubescens TaxID=1316194 RepID=A0A1Q5T3J5_9EURO|nr:Oleate hydratase [Penicillium subrubescens]
MHDTVSSVRDPESTQAWLVGSGIASLAAAVHLIRDARLPGRNIHILDRHAETGGGITSAGNAENGYILYPGSLPYFHDECVDNLLSLVPSASGSDKSLLDTIRDFQLSETPPPGSIAKTRFLRNKGGKCERSEANHLSIGPYNRLQLMKVLLEGESLLGRYRIQDFFGDEFFGTDFWALWSTTAIEFQRCLRKHLPDIHSLNNVSTLDRTRYSLYESIILPISTYLRSEGVNFHFNAKVVDMRMTLDDNLKGDPTTVTEIVLREHEEERIVNVDPNDLTIVTIGSPNSGYQLGTNSDPPPYPSDPDDFTYGDWSLWFHLAQKATKFGVPLNFNSHTPESTLVTFTVTLHDSEFMLLYQVLTNDMPGSTTSALLPRVHKNRPEVIPPNTTNIALVGQFTEIPRDTTYNMEYSVRGAQTAVYALMGLPKSPPRTKRSLLLDVFDLLAEG